MVLKPRPFLVKICVVEDILIRVEEKLGTPRDSGIFLYGVQLLAGISDRNFDSKCRVFESFGWKKLDVEKLIRKNPLCFTSSEAKINKSLEFLMNELGCDPACECSRRG
ncbi:hypothetical protein BVRB_3g060010 [Beta vulgaris subsp. vulgaris]|nr:hypothetical protein BVRB_3g060010 [Beta vulgaris subsp. vulgaris]